MRADIGPRLRPFAFSVVRLYSLADNAVTVGRAHKLAFPGSVAYRPEKTRDSYLLPSLLFRAVREDGFYHLKPYGLPLELSLRAEPHSGVVDEIPEIGMVVNPGADVRREEPASVLRRRTGLD